MLQFLPLDLVNEFANLVPKTRILGSKFIAAKTLNDFSKDCTCQFTVYLVKEINVIVPLLWSRTCIIIQLAFIAK